MSEIKCPLMDKEVREFKCNNSSIEEQIRDSYFVTLLKQAYGHQIIVDGIVVGYYMIYYKGISLEEINRIAEEEYESNMKDYYTAVHIRYIAIDERVQKKGIGTHVLKGLISDILQISKNYPIRLITIDALEKYHEWYKKLGFKDISENSYNGLTFPMFIDCMSKEDKKRLDEFCQEIK